jgi:hypothetical protein
MLVSCLVYSLTLMMEATYSSGMWGGFQKTIWHYIPEDRLLQIQIVLTLFNYIKKPRKIVGL